MPFSLQAARLRSWGADDCSTPFAHLFASLEVWDVLGGNIDQFASFWVSSSAGRPVANPKTSETANFDSITTDQCIANCLKNFLDGDFSVFGDQTGKARRHGGYELRACHQDILPLVWCLAIFDFPNFPIGRGVGAVL